MAKTWSADNPKAALMAEKRAALVEAALHAFLEAGYAEASVNQIAADAGVSIKTLYRHFDNKDDLFSAVMQAACGRDTGAEEKPPAWYDLPPEKALPLAGKDYLRHVLATDQIALYRVVVRDAHRFPELGARYLDETAGRRDAIFAGYIGIWASRAGWRVDSPQAAAQVFASLLKAKLFDDAVLGLRNPSEAKINQQAQRASQTMLHLLDTGQFR
jgi:AcrR family transcriptional regulator